MQLLTNIKPIIEIVLKKAREKSKITKDDEELIEKAYAFAEKWHHGQKRLTGDPYIVHSLYVAYYLAELRMDASTIAAGLLHDVPEDTKCDPGEIKKEFGEEINRIVEGVTRLGGVKYFGKRGRVEDLRKLLVIMAKDLRVVIVKLADRLHNIQTLSALSPQKRKKIAAETIEVYAPLASRLGMGEMKGILEDLSFKYYLPKEFKRVSFLLEEEEKVKRDYIKMVIEELKNKLKKTNIKAAVEGRVKHLWSLYLKLKRYNDDFSKIYDVVAVRIIVDTVSDCYKVLGIVHEDWKPLIKRIKDYIAVSKPNGYRSLHTTVICLEGKILEIQIRTKKMHEEAEWGIAGHHLYELEKESKIIGKKLDWIKQLIDWQKDLEASAFMEGLKIDVFKDRIFVFTPKGEALDLPEGATPVDFAYLIHTQIGNSCIGAKVNGKIVPLNTSLQNGDMVEILTSKKILGPSRDWLRFVKTSLALSSIRRWFKGKDRGQDLSLGKELLGEELKKIGKSVEKIRQKELEEYLLKTKQPYKDLEAVLVAIGRGYLSPKQIVSGLFLSEEKIDIKKRGFLKRFFPFLAKPKIRPKVVVQGEENFLINFAFCCKPKPPDKIIGFITRGKGLTVHKKTCSNIKKEDERRFINVSWVVDEFWEVPVYIEAEKDSNILKDLTELLDELKIGIKNVNFKTGKFSKIIANLRINNKQQLKNALEKIPSLSGVRLVKKI